ncbi:MAG: cell division protein FtsA [bacterium]
MSKNNEMFVGLDIGTSKICAVVAEFNDEGTLEIVGLGKHPSKGLNRGSVVNIDQTVESICAAVEEAEFISGIQIKHANVGISGPHIKSLDTNGIVAIKNKIVSKEDVQRVIEQARAITMPTDHQIIHVLPQEYVVDEQESVTEPVGMAGVRLECKVHIVTGSVPSIQNIVRSVERSGLMVERLVLQPLASSMAALSEDERDLGVAVVDIGSGTSDVAVISSGVMRYAQVVPIGGSHITRDIAIGLRTPDYQAERIKKEHGYALASRLTGQQNIEVPSVGGREPRILSRQILAEIIQPRLEEILTMIRRSIQKSGMEDLLPAGVVLTGGASIIEGIEDLAESVLQLPVRRGSPSGIGGLVDMVNQPLYSTAVGLVMYAAENGVKDQKNWFSSSFINGNSGGLTLKIKDAFNSIFK